MNLEMSPLDHHARLIAAAEAARDAAVAQARTWAQEARTQRGIVVGILRELGLPLVDYNAERLVVEHVEKLEAMATALQNEVKRVTECLMLADADRVAMALDAGVDAHEQGTFAREMAAALQREQREHARTLAELEHACGRGTPELPAGWEVQRTPVHGEPEECWDAMRMEDGVEVWLYDDGQVEIDNAAATLDVDELVAVLQHLRARRVK